MSIPNTILFVAVFSLITALAGCSKSLPTIEANSSIQLTEAVVLDAAFSRDNQRAFVLTQGPIFSVWDISTGEVLASIGPDQLAADTRSFAISDTEEQLLTNDGISMSLWRLDDFSLTGSIDFKQQLGDAHITSMAFIADSVLVAGNSDGTVIFADIANQVFRQSHFHDNEVVKLLPGKKRSFLYSVGNDGKVVVTDLRDYSLQQEYSAPFRITSLVSNNDNSLFFISDALNRQVFWQPGQNQVINKLDYWQQYRFFRLGMFIHNDAFLLTASPKTEISLWDSDTGEERASWQATSQSLGSMIMDIQQISEKQLITLTSDAVIETWNLETLF